MNLTAAEDMANILVIFSFPMFFLKSYCLSYDAGEAEDLVIVLAFDAQPIKKEITSAEIFQPKFNCFFICFPPFGDRFLYTDLYRRISFEKV
jgi:hypothetical protein